MANDLTEKQQVLLTRLREGVDPSSVTYTERGSARALERRGLVKITGGHGDNWRYEVTTAGQTWIPAPPPPHDAPKEKLGRGAAKPLDALIEKTLAAGGELHDRDDVNSAQAIITSGLRVCDMPGGHVLWVHHVNHQRVVTAVPRPEWMVVGAPPIVVPERVTRFRPAVRELRENRVFAEAVDASARGRASRILHALALTAESRGWSVSCPLTPGYQRPRPGMLRLSVQGSSKDLSIKQDYDRVPHVASKSEQDHFNRYGYPRIPDYDYVTSQRLIITIDRGYGETAFKDTKTTNLEDKLDGILRLVEYHAFEMEQQRLEHEAEERRRQEQWEQIRAQAEIDLQLHARRTALDERLKAWESHGRRLRYLEALSERITTLDGEAREAAEEWLVWCRDDVSKRDPWDGAFTAPAPVTVTHENLKPFMRGWSTYSSRRDYS